MIFFGVLLPHHRHAAALDCVMDVERKKKERSDNSEQTNTIEKLNEANFSRGKEAWSI